MRESLSLEVMQLIKGSEYAQYVRKLFSYANALDSRIIKDLVDNLYIEPVNTNNQSYSVTNKNLTNLHTFENPLQSWDSAIKIQLLQNINQIARSKNYVTNVIASINLEYDQIYLARSDERHFSDIRPLIHLSITIIVSKDGKMERAAAGGGGRYSLDYFSLEMVTAYIEKAYAQAQLKLEAKSSAKWRNACSIG